MAEEWKRLLFQFYSSIYHVIMKPFNSKATICKHVHVDCSLTLNSLVSYWLLPVSLLWNHILYDITSWLFSAGMKSASTELYLLNSQSGVIWLSPRPIIQLSTMLDGWGWGCWCTHTRHGCLALAWLSPIFTWLSFTCKLTIQVHQ